MVIQEIYPKKILLHGNKKNDSEGPGSSAVWEETILTLACMGRLLAGQFAKASKKSCGTC